MRALLAGFVALIWTAGAVAAPGSKAVLQALDKTSARVTTLEIEVGRAVRFGTLEILVRRCERSAEDEAPESAVFLQVREARPGEAARALFSGWMFASSPALSALEHPVYDVWVLDCKSVSTSGGASPP